MMEVDAEVMPLLLLLNPSPFNLFYIIITIIILVILVIKVAIIIISPFPTLPVQVGVAPDDS